MADDLKVAAQFAAVVEGRLVQVPSDDDSGYTVVTLTTHRDVANNVKRKCVSRRVVTPTSVTVVQPPTEVVASYIERRSPSGKWNAIVREVKGVTPADTKEWLQVYETDTMTLVHSLDLTTHGDIYFDDFFASVAWSPDETRIALIVEPKEQPQQPSSKLTDTPKAKFAYKKSFGETYGTKARPCVCLIDLSVAPVSITVHSHVTQVGSVVFSADSRSLYFTRILTLPRGIAYCFNRKSSVYSSDLSMSLDSIEALAEDVGSARSLRLSPDGAALVFLHNSIEDPHNSIASVGRIDLSTKTCKSVTTAYVEALPSNCWIQSSHIVYSSSVTGRQLVTVLDVLSGSSSYYDKTAADLHAWTVLDVSGKSILVSASSPSTPHTLVVLRLDTQDWIWSERVVQTPHKALPIQFSTIASHTIGANSAGAFLIYPSDSSSDLPLIVMPHGGPHSTSTLEFSYYAAAFALHGYATLLVNYRGSTGYSDESLRSLLGKIGTQDVEDVHHFVQLALENETVKLDRTRIALFGGSHGGFITAHLLGQKPDFYVAGAMRNPVIDVAAMLATTDIPDWTASESGLSVLDPLIPTSEIYQKLYDVSPIKHVQAIKAPVLLLLGEEDKRVPPSQGLLLANCIRHLSPKVNLYPGEGHALGGIETETDVYLSTVEFFDRVFKK